MPRIGMEARLLIIGVLAVSTTTPTASAQEAVPDAITAAYASSLSALQSVKSPQEIHRMMEAMDLPDWVSITPSGEKIPRDEAEKQLAGLLEIPACRRPIPLKKIVYAAGSDSRFLVVYWVYRKTEQGPVGSMVRDTWIQTQSGWRRSIHEKFFPDRPIPAP